MGWKAKFDVIELNKSDWIYRAKNPAGPFPAGTVVEVVWENGTTWPGTIAGDVVSWLVESDVAAEIPNDMRFSIMVRYPNLNGPEGAMLDYEWRMGRSVRITNN